MAKKKKGAQRQEAVTPPQSTQTSSVVEGGEDMALALKAVHWLTSPDAKKQALFEALLEAVRPLVLLRAAKYEVDAKEQQKALVAAGNPANARAGAGLASNAASRKRPLEASAVGPAAPQPSSEEVDKAVRYLRSLLIRPEELLSKACKSLRTALHPLVEQHLHEEKASPAFRITSMLGQQARWPEALKVLNALREAETGKKPKLGAYQRWVRELNVAEGNPTELLMLDAIMRVAAGHPPCKKSPAKGALNLVDPWRPELPELRESRATSESATGPATAPATTSTANKLISLIATRRSEAPKSFGAGSWRILAHEVASERVPPNHFDLDIFSCAPHCVPLNSPSSRATQRHDVPGVEGAFVLSDVLSVSECDSLRAASESMGYRPDVPLSSQLDERAHNVVLMANEVQSKALFERVKRLLPQELGGDKLQGLNRRWRLYRYLSGNLYRKHLDGAWPASGISLNGGVEEYVYDAYGGGTRSRFTFIIYLNDDFEGGCTTFFTPKPGCEGTVDSRPVKPCIGSATVFPHGDTGIPLLHEGSAVTSGTKYLLRTDVIYARPETPAELKQAARIRGLARQLGGLGGKGLVEESADKEGSASGAGKKKRVIKSSLKDGKRKGRDKKAEGPADDSGAAAGKKGKKLHGKDTDKSSGQRVLGGYGKRAKKRGSMAKRR